MYGHTRWGKTYAIRYCVRLLRKEVPRVVVISVAMPQNLTRLEGLFFGMILDAAQHARPDSGTAIQRRLRLYNRLSDIVTRAEANALVVFVDEAQRLEVEHYEWLRDVQDELSRRGVRSHLFFVGQPGILNRKSAFKQNVDTSQIVARFMVEEMRFSGARSAADLEMTLAAYDTSVYPEGTDWSYTRFFAPHGYRAGFRLSAEQERLWNAFETAHRKARFDFPVEIPMEYLARAIESALIENMTRDDFVPFKPSSDHWDTAVEQSNFVAALEQIRIVFVDETFHR